MEQEERGFNVSDRRIRHDKDDASGTGSAEKQAARAEKRAGGEKAAKEPPGSSGGEPGAAREAAAQGAEKKEEGEFTLPKEGPPIDFSVFVFSLARTALMYMGLEQNPEGDTPPRDLAVARQHIDILGMLEEKTRGNLTPEESELISKMLYTLRIGFVEVSKNAGQDG